MSIKVLESTQMTGHEQSIGGMETTQVRNDGWLGVFEAGSS